MQRESIGVFEFIGQVLAASMALILRLFTSTEKVLDTVDKGVEIVDCYADNALKDARGMDEIQELKRAAKIAALRKQLTQESP